MIQVDLQGVSILDSLLAFVEIIFVVVHCKDFLAHLRNLEYCMQQIDLIYYKVFGLLVQISYQLLVRRTFQAGLVSLYELSQTAVYWQQSALPYSAVFLCSQLHYAHDDVDLAIIQNSVYGSCLMCWKYRLNFTHLGTRPCLMSSVLVDQWCFAFLFAAESLPLMHDLYNKHYITVINVGALALDSFFEAKLSVHVGHLKDPAKYHIQFYRRLDYLKTVTKTHFPHLNYDIKSQGL